MLEERDNQEAGAARRALLVLRAGGRAFGLFADETEEVTKLRGAAAPLPFAPPGVLGVVAVRGRMRTLIDPLPLLARAAGAALTNPPVADANPPEPDAQTTGADTPQPSAAASSRLAVVLRGDEQLALVVERVERVIEIPPHAITPLDPPHDFARGRITYDAADLLILDPARIFEAVMRGYVRRRVR